ncbi:citrate lyase holo-[acyl-carrier protein] synthase [Oceanirhabdus sp. W0125-5]|uniref:citrate lyase holo-[acyl-carrier protein] synthase n=1 Tax=Oceanirhabdus sp. W0125-5 TaxID=2999116 RepID=UPI0022F2F705|nr:citrate lyase holo-[acyl-carrier protein] synthase [Oceanirhabdus sp. W0125-5]WBW98043.1 citrate lyase holo-[acyl-carrier protein] synthase [Oceanirhabdus sp. W0125-5]
MYTIQDLLDARELRVEFINELIERYNNTVISLRVNYPGLEKDNAITRKIMEIIGVLVSNLFSEKIKYTMTSYTAEGPIMFYVIDEEVENVKSVTIDIEDRHTLGRCIDLDVYNTEGESISRVSLGKNPRSCFICDKPAHECVRSRAHSYEEIAKFIADRYNDYLENMYDRA